MREAGIILDASKAGHPSAKGHLHLPFLVDPLAFTANEK